MVALSASYLASAYVQLVRLDDARRCISEAFTATETTGERWCEAEINRIAGEIELKSPGRDAARRKHISCKRSPLRASSKQNPGNSAPR